MKKFRFRLQKVLDYRTSIEGLAKEAYLEARAERLAGEVELQRIKDARKEVLFRPSDTLQARKEIQAALEHSDDQERAQATLIEQLRGEEEARRDVWLLRKQEAEALTKLREKAHGDWALEETRAEQRGIDEWAATRKVAVHVGK